MEGFGTRPPQRLLVTGAEGMVGANLAVALAERFEVLALASRHSVALPNCRAETWEPERSAAWVGRVKRFSPSWIVHAGPLAAGSWDIPQQFPHPEAAARTARLLAKLAADSNGRLTIISTDALFIGPRLFHDEEAAAGARGPFVRAVLAAENVANAAGALVVRTHAYGWSPPGEPPGFAERAWETLLAARPCPSDHNRHATPILVTDLAPLLERAYRRGLSGRYHMAGAERTSAHRFAAELSRAFSIDFPRPAAEPVGPIGSAGLPETSLSTRRARRVLDRPMPMLREGLTRFAEQATTGHRARLHTRPHPQLPKKAA